MKHREGIRSGAEADTDEVSNPPTENVPPLEHISAERELLAGMCRPINLAHVFKRARATLVQLEQPQVADKAEERQA